MATYNSAAYAAAINSPSSGTGVPSSAGYAGQAYLDGSLGGGNRRTILVQFDTSVQALNNGDSVNLAVLPAGIRPVSVRAIVGTGTASATIQVGTSGSASYFSSSAISAATAGNLDAFTNLANYGNQLSADTTVVAAIAGANLTANTKLWFEITYLSN